MEHKQNKLISLKHELKESAAWTLLLTVFFIFSNYEKGVVTNMLTALPFFVVLYFLLFSIGREKVSEKIQSWINADIKKIVLFPAFLIVLYFAYCFLSGDNPLKGVVSMVPFLVFFPVLVFASRRKNEKKLDWLDFATYTLFLLPVTLINAKPAGHMPVAGNSFDSAYRIVIMLTAVYAFIHVRGLKDAGIFPVFKLRHLWLAIWVWAVFYVSVFIIGYFAGFIQIKGHDSYSFDLIQKICLTFIKAYLHTALFEELFFRGLLQNMLEKRIRQSNAWSAFWKWGLIILLPLSVLAGYTIKGNMQWFPAAVTLAMFLAAWFIEKSGKINPGNYTSLAITGVLFGLVHYHAGSIIYIGFASIAGWAYGYTWIKTKNVFYAALVHALVGISALVFGLELLK
ncbi:hypothetical protein SAMN05444274_104127 [Mariniphaga anaerophila]|uniref:CAAX prenyl protease 2/Lysostaphin resistance protein A-like domain-containing protein n=1 Tax=Mariniphaga anaerophila TaxID=1484053 RepID=A0A1M4ZZU0_9BACT|nr:CPBP family intramembrane glutamic endopeptidase [Mariniphaga anaerophila]SHF23553.1 hypothetical protein SAMN05444274_104127 [Mariniphaga anaerophila]